jgi:hypothetical protein
MLYPQLQAGSSTQRNLDEVTESRHMQQEQIPRLRLGMTISVKREAIENAEEPVIFRILMGL